MCHTRRALKSSEQACTRDGCQALGRDLPALLQVERGEAGHEGEALQPCVLDLVAALQVQLLQGLQALPLSQIGSCTRPSTLDAGSQSVQEGIAIRRGGMMAHAQKGWVYRLATFFKGARRL